MPEKQVFISWSGEYSKSVALHLRDFLEYVLPECRLWMSSEDISKGRQWPAELSSILLRPESFCAVIVLTPDNLQSDWLLYEAGACAAAYHKSLVCPIACDVPYTKLPKPLQHFQATDASSKIEMKKLVRSIAGKLDPDISAKWPVRESYFSAQWVNYHKSIQAVKGNNERTESTSKPESDPYNQIIDLLNETLKRIAQLELSKSPVAPPSSYSGRGNRTRVSVFIGGGHYSTYTISESVLGRWFSLPNDYREAALESIENSDYTIESTSEKGGHKCIAGPLVLHAKLVPHGPAGEEEDQGVDSMAYYEVFDFEPRR
ncbi:MAG: toll/interleukin-1 receptor domain-containing protein [Phycisphaerales bacterium]|nr:toll/interleukin-1 receptor domain-containing protein [Planctomycetota bacterium]MCH8509472.1 toll/interleukin-1 receptor domain-containing protein [Phycisphaerales bacterium]